MPNPAIRHLPATRMQYEDVLIDVSLYLGCAMMVFFALNWRTINACDKKKKEWAELEDSHFERRDSGSGVGSSVSNNVFDTNAGTFLKVKAYLIGWLSEPEYRISKEVSNLFGRVVSEEEFEKNLRLSWYFRVNVDESMMLLLCVPWTTWLHLLCWYVLLTFLAACWMVTYVHVMCIVTTVSGAILLIMYRQSRYRSRLIVSLQLATDVSDGDAMSPKLKRNETQRLHEAYKSTWGVSTETCMEALRISIIIFIFGAAQFIGSAFCWKYYFWYNLAFCFMVVVFLLSWCFEMVYIIPVFAAANALPPIVGDDKELLRHAQQVVASFQDESERAFWDDKVETGRLAVADGAILGHRTSLQGTPSASQVTKGGSSAV
jgi:hypothetical protein